MALGISGGGADAATAKPPTNGSGSLGGGSWGTPLEDSFLRVDVALRLDRLSDDWMVSRCVDLDEAAVSRRDVREDLLSGRLDGIPSDTVDDRCLLSDTTCLYIDCLARSPCNSRVMILRTSGR